MNRNVILTAFSIVLFAAAGFFAGVSFERRSADFHRPQHPEDFEKKRMPGFKDHKEMFIQKLTEDLSLNSEQREAILEILTENDETILDMRDEMKTKFIEMHDSLTSKIMTVLNDEQKEKMEKKSQEIKEKMGRDDFGPPGAMGGVPPGPGDMDGKMPMKPDHFKDRNDGMIKDIAENLDLTEEQAAKLKEMMSKEDFGPPFPMMPPDGQPDMRGPDKEHKKGRVNHDSP